MKSTRFFDTACLTDDYLEQKHEINFYDASLAVANKCWSSYEDDRKRESSQGSLYCGKLGSCSYLCLKMANHPNFTSQKVKYLLDKASNVADAALEYSIGQNRHERVSLLEGHLLGAVLMKCAILNKYGKHSEATALADDILAFISSEVKKLPEDDCEVLYGRAGSLQAILFLRKTFEDNDFGHNIAVTIIKEIIDNGESISKECGSAMPLFWKWHGKSYLGAAHGVTGILYTLLCFHEEICELETYSGNKAIDLIRHSIEEIDKLCFVSGNLPSTYGKEKDELVHWCHGSPGYIFLLVKAYEVLNEVQYLRRAEVIARDVIYQRGLLKKGVGLCHGISGNAYTFLSIYRARNLEAERSNTGKDLNNEESSFGKNNRYDSEWIRMAKEFASFAFQNLEHLEHVPDRPYSLFEGLGGLSLLLLDLSRPNESHFPLFEY